MSKTGNTFRMLSRLQEVGISCDDAISLRRISMTLQRWFELECGGGNDHGSWCITRGHKANGEFVHDDDGRPFMERHYYRGDAKAHYSPIADREIGARKRLAKIMARYPGLSAYVQTDPRGCALYVLPPGVTAENYNRGIAVTR